MSESGAATGGVPAGWYADPAGSADLRFWDGQRWTTHLRPVAVAAPPVVVPPIQAREPVAQTQEAPAEKPYVPFSSPTSAPPPVIRGVAYTRTVWWLCFQPLWGLATQAVLYVIATAFGPVPPLLLVAGFVVLNLALLALFVRLAFADRAALVAGGNGTAASPWWVLLTPLVYLVLRGREVKLWEEAGAYAPVIWWVVALVVSPGLAVLGVFAAYGIFTP